MIIINPGVFYAFSTICFMYISYRLYQVGLKGSELAKDYSRCTFVFMFALGSVTTGLLFFQDQPLIAAFVAKIIGFGFWYLALVFMVPIFCKLVIQNLPSGIPMIALTIFGIFLTIYHLFHLTPLYISADGVPLWNIDPLVTSLQGLVTVIFSIFIGGAFAQQAIKAKHTIRGILIGGGNVMVALFTPLTYAVNTRELFQTLIFLSTLSYIVLILSVWTGLFNINEMNYDNQK